MTAKKIPFENCSSNLRLHLRDATRDSHDRLDQLMSRLDLRRPEDRDAFSRMQYRGFLRLARACLWHAAEASALLRRTTEGLGRDYPDEQVEGGDDEPLDADAVAYVTLGSQLGLTVLRRDLDEDQRTGIFAQAPEIDTWKAFAARVGAMRPDTAAAARTTADARRAFDIFHNEAARQLMTTIEPDL